MLVAADAGRLGELVVGSCMLCGESHNRIEWHPTIINSIIALAGQLLFLC